MKLLGLLISFLFFFLKLCFDSSRGVDNLEMESTLIFLKITANQIMFFKISCQSQHCVRLTYIVMRRVFLLNIHNVFTMMKYHALLFVPNHDKLVAQCTFSFNNYDLLLKIQFQLTITHRQNMKKLTKQCSPKYTINSITQKG